MWFDPKVIAQPSQPLAILATPATFAQKTGDGTAKVAEIATPLCRDNETASYRWLIHCVDRNPLEVAFSPAASHAEVLDAYPHALAVEPLEGESWT